MCTRSCNSFSDQTNAIPHWLWNQPSAPPVHPEDGVKGCLGNAMKVSEPQKMSSCHSQINLARLYPLQAKSINAWIQVDHGIMGWWFLNFLLYHQKTIMQIGTGCAPVGGTCVQDRATHSVIRLMRYLTGCGISPLHHRFTPKMESKGVSEMLWKCRSRKKCHHATPISTWQGSTLWKQNQEFRNQIDHEIMRWIQQFIARKRMEKIYIHISSFQETYSPLPTHGCHLVSLFRIRRTKKLGALLSLWSMSSSMCTLL